MVHGSPNWIRQIKGCPLLVKDIWRCRQSSKLVVFGHDQEDYERAELPFDGVQQLHEGILLGLGDFRQFLSWRLLFLQRDY